jgi:O-antigen/teichoic acid export membrane protein
MACSWVLFQGALRAECRRHGIRIRFSGLRGELSVLTRLAIPAAASGCIGGLAVSGANALVIRRPGGFTQMAIFNAANCLRLLVIATPGMVARVSTPILCSLRAADDLARYRRLLRMCLASSAAMAAAAATLLSLLADPLLRLFGKDFSHGKDALALLMAAAVAEVVAVTLYQPLFSHGRLWLQFRIIIVWSGVLLGGVWYGVAGGGAAALAASYLAAWICGAAAYGITARRLAKVDADKCGTGILPVFPASHGQDARATNQQRPGAPR